MSVEKRVQQVNGSHFICLDADEASICGEMGWKFVRFHGGKLVEAFDPIYPLVKGDSQVTLHTALSNAMQWIEGANGDVWFAACTPKELYKPRRILLDDAASVEFVRSIISEIVKPK